jgi:hypothetical protein
VHRSVLTARRDPFWGFDGRAVAAARRRRRLVATVVTLLSITILGLIAVRLTSMDTAAALRGPNALLLATSLASDAMACCLIFDRESRRRAALRGFGDGYRTATRSDGSA